MRSLGYRLVAHRRRPGAPAPGSGRPVVAVDARCLQRQGIGFYAVLQAILGDLQNDRWPLVLVSDDAAHCQQLRAQHADSEIVYLPKTTWLWWEQVQVARWLFQRRPDIWIAPTNSGVPVVRPRRTRCLLVVHDLIPVLLPRAYLVRRPLWAAMYLISITASVLSANWIVAVSDCTAADLRRLSRRRATVVHPPVPSRASAAEHPRPLASPYIVYNGGFDTRKNVAQLLDAFAAFRETASGAGCLLVVLGDRPDLAEAMLTQRGLAAASLVTGFVAEHEKWDYLVNALAVLYPSTYEGFGLVVAEAFAAGVPVVSGTGGALREVGGEGAIFVDPMSVPSITRGLSAACDPAVRARAVSEGHRQLELLRARSGGYATLLRSLCST